MGGRVKKRRSYTHEQYQEAMRLIQSGLSLRKAAKILGIPWQTIHTWQRRGMPQYMRWEPKPSPELAYVLGVLHGDGTVYHDVNNRQYSILLDVNDYEFAYEFSRAVATVLGKQFKKPKERRHKSSQYWCVKYFSRAFYEWYRSEDLNGFKKYIEHNRECVRMFLRGVFDSEGSNQYRYSRIMLFNTDLNLLKYVQYLLRRYYGIPSYIKLVRMTKRGKPFYKLTIYGRNARRFLSEIGFTIIRKQKPEIMAPVLNPPSNPDYQQP